MPIVNVEAVMQDDPVAVFVHEGKIAFNDQMPMLGAVHVAATVHQHLIRIAADAGREIDLKVVVRYQRADQRGAVDENDRRVGLRDEGDGVERIGRGVDRRGNRADRRRRVLVDRESGLKRIELLSGKGQCPTEGHPSHDNDESDALDEISEVAASGRTAPDYRHHRLDVPIIF